MTTILQGGDSSGSNALMFLLAIIVLAAIGFGVYYYSGNNFTAPSNTTVVMPTPSAPAAPAVTAPAAPATSDSN